MKSKTYRELEKIDSFEERYEYLRLKGTVGESTFGFDRHLNQAFYTSQRWRSTRDKVIIRDEGCDLGIEGLDINDMIIVHHMNPMTAEEVERDCESLYDPEYLICCSNRTHQAIHYGDATLLPTGPVVRRPNDTAPWKRQNGSNSEGGR